MSEQMTAIADKLLADLFAMVAQPWKRNTGETVWTMTRQIAALLQGVTPQTKESRLIGTPETRLQAGACIHCATRANRRGDGQNHSI